MVFELFQKFAVSGFAAAAAIGASLVSSASVDPQPAYPTQASKLEAAAAAANASRLFDRADLDKNGALDREEHEILAVVTAELAQLNGFVSIDAADRRCHIASTRYCPWMRSSMECRDTQTSSLCRPNSTDFVEFAGPGSGRRQRSLPAMSCRHVRLPCPQCLH